MFSDVERTDVRRFCGYPAYGAGAAGNMGWRFYTAYGALEYRLSNLSAAEEVWCVTSSRPCRRWNALSPRPERPLIPSGRRCGPAMPTKCPIACACWMSGGGGYASSWGCRLAKGLLAVPV